MLKSTNILHKELICHLMCMRPIDILCFTMHSNFHLPLSIHDHWQPLTRNDSPAKYAGVVEKFFLVALQSLNKHPSTYNIPLTPIQKVATQFLFKALMLQSTKAIDCFYQFLWSLLVCQKEENKEVTLWTCPFLCYFVVQVLHKNSNFMSPDGYSGIAAKFKYFCNTVAIFEVDLQADYHPQSMIG